MPTTFQTKSKFMPDTMLLLSCTAKMKRNSKLSFKGVSFVPALFMMVDYFWLWLDLSLQPPINPFFRLEKYNICRWCLVLIYDERPLPVFIRNWLTLSLWDNVLSITPPDKWCPKTKGNIFSNQPRRLGIKNEMNSIPFSQTVQTEMDIKGRNQFQKYWQRTVH